jgi:hypothetical protein
MKEPQKSFHQARLKIDRAYEHIADFDWHADAYIVANASGVVVKVDTQGIRIFPNAIVPIPSALALTLGDVVHNLKSALDYCWTGIHRAALPDTERREVFPIGNTRNDAVGRLKEAAVESAFPNIKIVIGDLIRPYTDVATGGNPNFTVINHLDRWDKHNLLVPALAVWNSGEMTISNIPMIGKLNFKGMKVYSDEPFGLIEIVGLPPEVAAQLAAKVHIQQNAESTTQLVFGQGQPLEHEPIAPALSKLAESAKMAVETFISEIT